MRLWHFLFVLFVTLLGVQTTMGASCPDLHGVAGSIGYQHRSEPDRCEGFYQSPIAGESLELLSFVSGRIEFDPRTDRNLTITAPDVSTLGASRVSVVARALSPRDYYRMDATLESAGTLRWPLAEVVIPAKLAPNNLGLLGRIESSGRAIFVPLRVSAMAVSPPNPKPAIITFRAPTDLQAFQWRLYGAGGTAPDWNTFGGLGHMVRSGDPIVLTLDRVATGVMTLDIAAKPVNTEYFRSQWQIFAP